MHYFAVSHKKPLLFLRLEGGPPGLLSREEPPRLANRETEVRGFGAVRRGALADATPLTPRLQCFATPGVPVVLQRRFECASAPILSCSSADSSHLPHCARILSRLDGQTTMFF
mmetsp:Transcript_25152/g.52593  ORF Transcript_25152/g.52593 Transcript_25152/m.52593 type:complete len:114 (-) Transcript_25152:555-896(-)